MVNPDSLANELWMQIFETMDNPADLANVVLANRKFYSLGIRALYTHIVWDNPVAFARNHSFWETHPNFTTFPRSVKVRIVPVEHETAGLAQTVSVVGLDGRISRVNQTSPNFPGLLGGSLIDDDTRQPKLVASIPLYKMMISQIQSFAGLQELILNGILLDDYIYSTIHALPALANLEISQFYYPSPDEFMEAWDHSTLPITSLTIGGFHGFSRLSLPNVHRLLSLVSAHNLRKLKLDWTPSMRQLVSEGPTGYLYHLPQNITYLEARMPPQPKWPLDADTAMNILVHPFRMFLAACPTISHLVILNHMPFFSLPRSTLPCLRFYKGPLPTLVGIVGNRPLESLDIGEMPRSCSEYTKAFSIMPAILEDLREININIMDWDEEILYAVTQLFTTLRKLRVVYSKGGPSDDFLLGLGYRFLTRLPRLECIHMYQLKGNPPQKNVAPLPTFGPHLPPRSQLVTRSDSVLEEEDIDREIDTEDAECEIDAKETLQAWRRPCPGLREVQFIDGYVWKRASDTDEWTKRSP